MIPTAPAPTTHHVPRLKHHASPLSNVVTNQPIPFQTAQDPAPAPAAVVLPHVMYQQAMIAAYAQNMIDMPMGMLPIFHQQPPHQQWQPARILPGMHVGGMVMQGMMPGWAATTAIPPGHGCVPQQMPFVPMR